MSPSCLKDPGPEGSHSSASQSQDNQSSPDPISVQHNTSPREEPQGGKSFIGGFQRGEPSGNDLGYTQLRSQHSLFVDQAPTERQLPLPLLHEPQISTEGSTSGAKENSSHIPPSLETRLESGNQAKFQTLISRPENIQSVENIHAEGFNFPASNLRPIIDSKAKGYCREKPIRHNASSSISMRPYQGKANSGVVSYSPFQDGEKAESSGHQDLTQRGEKKLANSAGSPQESSLATPDQNNCAPSKVDRFEFRVPDLPDPTHQSMDNKLANQRESNQAALANFSFDTNMHIDDGQKKRKRSRLEVAQSSKLPARLIGHHGPNSTPEDPREVSVKTSQPAQRHAPGRLFRDLGPESSGKDQVFPEYSLSQGNSYHSPLSNFSVSSPTKHGRIIQQVAPNQETGVPFPTTQTPRSPGGQRVSGPPNARYQSQAPFHSSPVPEMEPEQASTSIPHSRSMECQTRVPGAIPDLTFNLHPKPHNTRGEACDDDHHMHSSPLNKSKQRDRLHKTARHRKSTTTPTTPGLKTGLNTIADEWNSFFINFMGYEKHMASKLTGFKRHIALQDKKIAGFQDELRGKEKEIESSKEKLKTQEAKLRDMMSEKEAAEAQAQKLERQLADSNTKAESLREKCQQMKSRFNEGLAEQQKFYVKNKEQCDKLLDAVQQEKQAREQIVKDARRACEETRIEFQKCLEAVKIEAFKQSSLCKSKTEPL